MKKKLVLLLQVLMISLFFVGCGGTDDAASSGEKIYEWDFLLTEGNVSSAQGKLIYEWTQKIKDLSNDRLIITVRPIGELPYKYDDAIRVTSDNSVQMSYAPHVYMTGSTTLPSITNLPFLCTSLEEYLKAEEILKEWTDPYFESQNLTHVFSHVDSAQRFFGTGEPIHSLKDLKGRKVRVYSAEQQMFLTDPAIKAHPVSIDFNEVPTSIQRGVADSLITGAFAAYECKFYDFIDWAYVMPFNYSGAFILVNNDALASLPEDLKTLLLEEGKKFEPELIQEIASSDQQSIDGLRNEGVEIIEFINEDAQFGASVMAPKWEEWAEKEGDEHVKALKAVREALRK